jgi:hypothetical protein
VFEPLHSSFNGSVSAAASRPTPTAESADSCQVPRWRGLANVTPQGVLWNVPGALECPDDDDDARKGSNGSVEVRRCGGAPSLDVIDNMAHGHRWEVTE